MLIVNRENRGWPRRRQPRFSLLEFVARFRPSTRNEHDFRQAAERGNLTRLSCKLLADEAAQRSACYY
jgi:hypothetical protein